MQTAILHKGVSIDIYEANTTSKLEVPYMDSGISAGFPSPALDFVGQSIDLNQYLIHNPSATFYGRAKGYSLQNAGISDGDLMIIDRSIEPSNGKIAVCFIDGEFTAKRLHKTQDALWLMPENEAYQPIKIEEDNSLIIWGIVTSVIKSF